MVQPECETAFPQPGARGGADQDRLNMREWWRALHSDLWAVQVLAETGLALDDFAWQGVDIFATLVEDFDAMVAIEHGSVRAGFEAMLRVGGG